MQNNYMESCCFTSLIKLFNFLSLLGQYVTYRGYMKHIIIFCLPSCVTREK
jgi:hypothetical protein